MKSVILRIVVACALLLGGFALLYKKSEDVAEGTSSARSAGQVEPTKADSIEQRFDVREARTKPAAEQSAQSLRESKLRAMQRLAGLVKGVQVDFDNRTGSPSYVASNRAFLTGANGEGGAVSAERARQFNDSPHGAAKAFVEEFSELFGHGAAVLESAPVVRDYTTTHNGLRTTVWQQEHGGIRVFEANFLAHVTSSGALVNVASRMIANAAAAAATGYDGKAPQPDALPVSVRRAVQVAGQTLGETVPIDRIAEAGPAEGASKRQRFRAPSLLDVRAEYVWLPMDEVTMRLCWEVECVSAKRGEMFRTLVDAETGEALVQRGLTEYISPASYRVFTHDSPTPMSPGHATPQAVQPSTVARELISLEAANVSASPEGWIPDGVNETRGNNVDAHLDLNGDNSPDLPRPQGVNRVFDPPLDLSQPPTAYREAAVVNLFYWNNRIHDRYYELGFTEAAGNFQGNNFGKGGNGNDAVQADAQDGSGTDNANFSTPTDGSPGRMQMFVFTGPTPDRDSSLDAEIIIHEYTHGLTNRLVGGGVGISALQSRGMGEGWSDFYALCLLSEVGDDPNGNYAKGGYSSRQISAGFEENYYFGIRRYPYSTDLAKNPLTFKDIDPTKASPHPGIPLSPRYSASNSDPSQVHRQGEVWCATLWQVRANLVTKHGAAAGNDLAMRLVTDGLKLSPANPTFVQTRDAILQAELIYTGGANRTELWNAFAKRGLGAGAQAPASSTTTGVTESFDIPDALSVTPGVVAVASGSIGGPFSPSGTTFILHNSGATSLSWSAVSSDGWLSFSTANGSLAPGAATQVEVALNASATTLPAGNYVGTVTFTNLGNGVTQTRSMPLKVDYLFVPIFADNFESGAFDPAFWTITGVGPQRTQITHQNSPQEGEQHVTMDASGSAYARNEATLMLNLSGQSNLVLRFLVKGFADEPHGPPPAPFVSGADFDGVAISSDGANWFEIAPLRSLSGTWQQMTIDLDAAVAAHGLTYGPNFKIRFNHFDNLAIPSDGLAFDQVVVANAVNRRLQVSIASAGAEGSAPISGEVQVTPVLAEALNVTLTSSDSTEAVVPASVVIPPGASKVPFSVSLPDDAELDGTQVATISATAATFVSGSASVAVHDTESAILTLELPVSAEEGTGAVTGMINLSAPPVQAIRVLLSTAETNEVLFPNEVEIAAGETSVPFVLTVVDDHRIEGPRPVTITASVQNWTAGVATMTVLDNESTALGLVVPSDFREADPIRTVVVSIPGTLSQDLEISLSNSDATELAVPASVTIQAGQTSKIVPVAVVDDAEQDGNQPVSITATAAGFITATVDTQVGDNELHHFAIDPIPSVQIRNAPITVSIRAVDVGGNTITNYGGSVSLSGNSPTAAIPIAPAVVPVVGGSWTGTVRLDAFADLASIEVDDGSGHIGVSNEFALRRGPLHAFEWAQIDSPQIVDTPFAASVRAVDAGGNLVETYDRAVSLFGIASSYRPPSGEGTESWSDGIFGRYRTSRVQLIYTPDEVKGAGKLTGMDLNLRSLPSGSYPNFTIRLKHTNKAEFWHDSEWEGDWTVVYQANQTVGSTGWMTFVFSVPFEYSGQSGLMVDISSWAPSGTGFTTPAAFEASRTSVPRAMYSSSGGGYSDPLSWIGFYPFASVSSNLPNVRFRSLSRRIPVEPNEVIAFSGGQWSGVVSFPLVSPTLALGVEDDAGVQGRSNDIAVANPPPLVGGGVIYREDFEAGSLSDRWNLSGNGSGRAIVTSADGPHGGGRHLTMDSPGFPSLPSRATWALDLQNQKGIVLKFWAKGFSESPDAPPASPFSEQAAFDGVAVSVDGVKWYEVQGLRSTSSPPLTNGWTQYTVDLDQAVKGFGIAYNAEFRVRFCQFGRDYIPYDGIAVDDIEVISNGSPLALKVLLPAQILEGTSAMGSVQLPFFAPKGILVRLSSNAPSKISVPFDVTVPAGSGSATFSVSALENLLVEGSKAAGIVASADYLSSGGGSLTVLDNDAPSFQFTLPKAEAAEGEPPIRAVITSDRVVAAPITFSVVSSDPTAINVTGSVTLPPGETSVEVPLTVVNDSKVDGTQSAIVTVSLNNLSFVSPLIVVADNETLDLRLTPYLSTTGASVGEGGGKYSYNLYLPGSVTTPTIITLSSSRPDRLAVPLPVTISAGSVYQTIEFTAVEDAIPALPETITLTASAPGFNPATTTIVFQDNDPHHFRISPIASPQVAGDEIPVTVTAVDEVGAVLTRFEGPATLEGVNFGGVTPGTLAYFAGGVWSGPVKVNAAAQGLVLRVKSSAGQQGLSNAFDVEPGSFKQFAWSPIPRTFSPGQNVPVMLRAVNAAGITVPVDEPVSIQTVAPVASFVVGDDTFSSSEYILPPRAFSAKAQTLYLASELGGQAEFGGLGLYVESGTGGPGFMNFTIRMKSTTRSDFSGGAGWEGDGWKVVHQSDQMGIRVGWRTFLFDRPFAYDGRSNLLVELSYRNPVKNSSYLYWGAKYAGTVRSVYGSSEEANDDPLQWVGMSHSPQGNSYFPTMRFFDLRSVPPGLPSVTVNGGVWTGQVAFPGMYERLFLKAVDASGRFGTSDGFTVEASPADPNSLIFSDGFEGGELSNFWTTSSVNYGNASVSSSWAPYAGDRHLILDGGSGNARSAATLSLDLTGYSSAYLSFWVKRFPGGTDDAPPSAPFPDGTYFDGVAISENGVQWYEVKSLRGMTRGEWTQIFVNVHDRVLAHGLTYTQNFKIRFSQVSSATAPSDGVAVDEVRLTGYGKSRLKITLPETAHENAGTITGDVTLPTVASSATIVSLGSSSPLILEVPATVTIGAGETSESFTATIRDNNLFNGTVPVTVSGTSPGLGNGWDGVQIQDDEVATMTMSVPPSVVENGGQQEGLLTVSPPAIASIQVKLTSSLPASVSVPSTITFMPGASSVRFPISIPDDSLLYGTRTAIISAEVLGWPVASAQTTVGDNESSIVQVYSGIASEGMTSTHSVALGASAGRDFVVSLISSEPSRLTVPESITIPMGSSSASFTATAVDNAALEGVIPVVVTPGAPGLTGMAGTIQVNDNDVHHFTIDAIGTIVRGQPSLVTITARDINDAVTSAFTGTVNLSAIGPGQPVAVSPQVTGAFVSGKWTGLITVNEFAGELHLFASGGGGHSGTSLPFSVGTGPAVRYEWGYIAPGRVSGVAFPIGLRVFDAADNEVTDHRGYVTLNSKPVERVIGSGSATRQDFPLYTQYHDERTQVLYSASEVGGGGLLTSLSLYVTTVPGQVLNNWTIRLKHTNLVNQTSAPWEGNGWTTVYQRNQTIGQTGWQTFAFSTPFEYNGTSNLLVDFSFNNSTSSFSSPGAVRIYTPNASVRTISGVSNSTNGSPLSWAGATPYPYVSSSAPQLIFNREGALAGGAVAVAPSALFLEGSPWTSGIWLHGVSGTTALVASDFNGGRGTSNEFTLVGAADGDGDRLPDFWENANGLNAAASTGPNGGSGDLDGDGISNLLEYLMNLDPRRFDLHGLPRAEWAQNTADGKAYLELRYRRRIGVLGINYGVETSSDMEIWSADPSNYETVGFPTPVGDGITEVVTVRVLPAIGTPGNSKRFARLKVVVP
jgi:hypothetical protein